MKRDQAMLSATLERAGLLRTGVPEADMKEQLGVFLEAMDIYAEREGARGGLWKEAGAIDSAHHLKSKGKRVFVAATHDDKAGQDAGEDEAVDAINYAAFFIRNYRAGRIEDQG